MTHKKSRQNARALVGGPSVSAAVAKHPRSSVLRDLLKGVLVFVLLLGCKLTVEHTTFGKQLALMSYNVLQLRLSAQRVPITIVDISDLEAEDWRIGGRAGKATPRDSLRAMIEAIASQAPRAIGVDIDFSPDENGYIHPRDPEFFQFCHDLQASTGIPVFLGIKRSLGKPPEEWLGAELYEDLAASILIPNDSRRMLNQITVSDEGQPGATGQEGRSSKSMSVLLADAYGRPSGGLHALVMWLPTKWGFTEKFAERRLTPGLAVEDFLVDFSPLESLEPLRTTNPLILGDPSQRKLFEGKVVIVGDATLNKATDTFVVPGRQRPYPGIFLHASAAYTLIRAPLYEVTVFGRLAIDALFFLASLVPILLIRRHYQNRNRLPQPVAIHRLEGWLVLLVASVAILMGVTFVRLTRIMWDDFLLALALLVFHPSFARRLESSWERVSRIASHGWRRLVFEHGEEKRD